MLVQQEKRLDQIRIDVFGWLEEDDRKSFKVKLTVGVSGPGRVSSSPAGISCPVKCSATFASGKAVVLRPTPAKGAKLVRWSGSCKGAKACRVTLDAPRSVKALFKR